MVIFEKNAAKEAPKRLTKTYGAVLAQVLFARGLKTPGEAGAFLNPGKAALHDPFLLGGMQAAVDRIRAAIENKEPVCIYGDYDVDGIAGTAILKNHLERLGADVGYYIPRRHEGYGLSMGAVQDIARRGFKLLITVDCGITCNAELALCAELGMDAIVSDHHQCPSELPKALAILNPLCAPEYPYKKLCGAGVALKLVQALSGDAAEDYMDLAAVATVADIVPLTGENRTIVARGLARINSPDCSAGLKSVIAAAGLNEKQIEAGHIAFGIAPRINAAGRLGDPGDGVRLFTAQEGTEGIALALDRENRLRQSLEQKILGEALEMLKDEDLVDSRAIVLKSERWNPGVIGIVASRLVEEYNKVVVLFSQEDGALTGSARSVEGVHLYEALASEGIKELFVRFGGHEQAAGMMLECEKFGAFKQAFEARLSKLPASAFLPRAKYDVDAPLSEISQTLVQTLKQLSPFGMGNPTPVLRASARLNAIEKMGADQSHIRAWAEYGGAKIRAVGFRMGGSYDELLALGEADILFSSEINEWQGRKSLQLTLKHVIAKTPNDPEEYIKTHMDNFFNAFLDNILYNSKRVALGAKSVDAFGELERLMQGQGTLVVCFTPSGARRTLNYLKERGLLGQLSVTTSAPGHKCAYNALVLAPKLPLELKNYKRVLLMDGAYSAGMLNEFLALRATVTVGDLTDDEFIGAFTLKREDMAQCYAAFKRLGSGMTQGEFLRAAGEVYTTDGVSDALKKWRLRAALKVFCELGLAEYSSTVRIVPSQKRELMDSETYAAISRAKQAYDALCNLLGGNKNESC